MAMMTSNPAAAASVACAALPQDTDSVQPLGGPTVAVPSNNAVWRMCDPITRGPAAAGGTLFIESVAVRADPSNSNQTLLQLVVFHEGRQVAVKARYHAVQTGEGDGVTYGLVGVRNAVIPCSATRPRLPDATILTCAVSGGAAEDGDLRIPAARPGAPPWELRLRWNYAAGGRAYDARIRMCAAAVPSMYACATDRAAAPRRVPRLGVCVSSLSNKHGTLAPKLVVDFIEYYRLLGVHHVAIHMRPDAAASVGAALTAAYAADAPHFIFEAIPSGYVTADPANLDTWAYYDQAATLNSCVGHMRGQVDWLGLFDIDEWLVDGDGAVAVPLATTLTRWGCGGGGANRVHSTACPKAPLPSAQVPKPGRLSCLYVNRDDVAAPFAPGGAYPRGATALQYFKRAATAAPSTKFPKLWCDPDAVAATWVHQATGVPGAAPVQVPTESATFRHFTSYFSARAETGTFPRATDAAFARRMADASAARLAHPACVAATSTATAAMAAAGVRHWQ